MLHLVSLIATVLAQGTLPNPPKLPAGFPPTDQTQMIPASFLADPVIVEAVNYVKSVVPASVLALPVSTYIAATPNAPAYKGDAAANCYYPTAQCIRSADTANFKADISKCNNANDWGLTYGMNEIHGRRRTSG